MSLHNEIMNIPAKPEKELYQFTHATAYKTGHRDARHAAAELSLATERYVEALEEALGKDLVRVIQMEVSR